MNSERIVGDYWGGPERNIAPNMYYPQGALNAGMPGVVVVHCTVGPASRLVDCEPWYENPRGLGFGGAAVAMQQEVALPPDLKIGSTTVVTVPFCLDEENCAPVIAEGKRAKDRILEPRS